ncbi:MAG: oxidoreductase, partial [Planctomycetes bacterium]|nr:oxidoreductase [Planctomycetota bacterium]
MAEPAKKKFRKFKAVIKDSVRETADTATLILETSEERDYKAGQFITIDPGQFPALERWCRYLEKLKGRKE